MFTKISLKRAAIIGVGICSHGKGNGAQRGFSDRLYKCFCPYPQFSRVNLKIYSVIGCSEGTELFLLGNIPIDSWRPLNLQYILWYNLGSSVGIKPAGYWW
jgi:hypothetical protein